MRNLGANRLLVLVDGKRWTPSVDGYTDISTVPTSMVGRIEILEDDASSIYGSDAIAGVVNIILKKTMVRQLLGPRGLPRSKYSSAEGRVPGRVPVARSCIALFGLQQLRLDHQQQGRRDVEAGQRPAGTRHLGRGLARSVAG